jgi:cytoskeletal protein CcmA (bactofilin family)
MKEPNGTTLKNASAQASKISVISNGTSIIGNMASDGAIRIDGEVLGDVSANSVTVGQSGRVDGTVHAQQVVILGCITGSVDGSDVHIESTARVHGDVRHSVLSVAPGAQIDGFFERAPLRDREEQFVAERTFARATASSVQMAQSIN